MDLTLLAPVAQVNNDRSVFYDSADLLVIRFSSVWIMILTNEAEFLVFFGIGMCLTSWILEKVW